MEWCAPIFKHFQYSMIRPLSQLMKDQHDWHTNYWVNCCAYPSMHWWSSSFRPMLKPVVWHVPRGAPAPFSLRMLDNDNTTNLQLPHHTSYNELQSSYNELQSSRSVFLTCCNCMSQYGIMGRYEHPSVALGSLPSQPICRDIRKRGSWRSLLPVCHPGTTPRVSSCTPSKTGSGMCVQPFFPKSLHAALLVANYS